ncbi:flagella basal body P-ring formation protein FlgA [Fluviispira vulneris]|uniref:flagella basal body P-ring formation protein FlgA n=1 Tax=Fluviispira vulneris TaxID=2763012 RepID=UPI001648B817|nr:flagella basal body P-ring formation protein FlgA [Fluviispira vulneris]
MIALPPQIYIEYKNLANDQIRAEIQKDLIAQVLKKNGFEENVIIENQLQKNPSEKDYILNVNCLQCNLLGSDENEVVFSSIHKSNTKNNYTVEYTFEVSANKNKRSLWKIAVTDKKIIYFISAKQNLQVNTILSSNNIEIKTCLTGDDKCSPKMSYQTSQEAIEQLKLFINKKTNKDLKVGQEIEIKNLSQEILVHTGEKTRITYKPSNTLTIQTHGKALSNGGLGEIIRVQINDWFEKNASFRPTGIIEGTVIAPGEVEYAIK